LRILADTYISFGTENLKGLVTRRRRRDTMSAEENKAIAQCYWDEIWSTGNVAMVDEFVAPDSLFHAGETIDSRDNEVRKQSTTRWRTSVPDLRATIEDIFAEGDKVVVR
jgi:predicted ester cyclase